MTLDVDVPHLIEALGDAFIASDREGRITVWNAAAERLFGFSRDEAIGQSLDIIIPEKQRARHWAGYAETMKTGQTRYATEVLRVPALHRDGHTMSIAFTVTLVGRDADHAGEIVAIVRDDSKRWTTERELRRRVVELEAKAA